MLTLEELKEMEEQRIIGSGVIIDSPEGINMSNSGRLLKWAAARGKIYDWTIYCHFDYNSIEWIRQYGDKIHSPEHIRKLVPCNDEALKMYRY